MHELFVKNAGYSVGTPVPVNRLPIRAFAVRLPVLDAIARADRALDDLQQLHEDVRVVRVTRHPDLAAVKKRNHLSPTRHVIVTGRYTIARFDLDGG
jgi:hypothetical protein